MAKSRFHFVSDKVVRTHLNRAFELVIELLTLSEARDFSPDLRSSFRKTVIIYTASIIEVLLLLILKASKNERECGEIKDNIVQSLYKINKNEKIALIKKKRIPAKFDKLNLDQINKLCKEHKLINRALSGRIDKVRELRNRQHLGSLKEIELAYTKNDLEFVFSVAKEVTDLAEQELTSQG